MTRQLIDVVKLSTTYLGDHGSDSPRLDAELLAAHALGIARLDVYLQHDRPLDDGELGSIRELVRRRAGGEPVAYILGRREFYGRDFAVSSDVLIPRPDTETLIETILAWTRDHPRDEVRILDVGTGSGCIAVTLAGEIAASRVVATDVSPAAVRVAQENTVAAGVGERVEIREGSWGEPLDPSEVFDIIVSNPPYILPAEMQGLDRDVRDHEPHLALRDGADDGLDSYREVARIGRRHLAESGILAVEVDYRRASAVAGVFGEAFEGAAVAVHADLAGLDRVVAVTRHE